MKPREFYLFDGRIYHSKESARKRKCNDLLNARRAKNRHSLEFYKAVPVFHLIEHSAYEDALADLMELRDTLEIVVARNKSCGNKAQFGVSNGIAHVCEKKIAKIDAKYPRGD